MRPLAAPPLAAAFFAMTAMAALIAPAPAAAAWRTHVVVPKYVSPAELATSLGARELGGRTVVAWDEGEVRREVMLRRNDAANRLVLDGTQEDVERLLAQIEVFDVAPRQIALEARIVEVDTDRARDLGIDWSGVTSSLSADFMRQSTGRAATSINRTPGYFNSQSNELQDRVMTDGERASVGLTNQLRLLEEHGAATYRDAPRLLTLNNRPATVLDGYRVTYVNRANGYANIFETETMDAGLRLEVTPSLVESGYLRLGIRAELSNLLQVENSSYSPAARDFASVSGSPIKRGQIVENTVMVRDGETVVLGGFTRTIDVRSRRDFPVLGRVLPFLFSRHVVTQSHHESIIVITPRVVDLAGSPSSHERELIGK